MLCAQTVRSYRSTNEDDEDDEDEESDDGSGSDSDEEESLPEGWEERVVSNG